MLNLKFSKDEIKTIRIVVLSFISILFILFFLYFLYSIKNIIFLSLSSAFLAFLFLPATNFFVTKFKIPKLVASLFTLLLVIGIFVFLGFIIIPSFFSQITKFVSMLPIYVEILQNFLDKLNTYFKTLNIGFLKDFVPAFYSEVKSNIILFLEKAMPGYLKKFFALANILPLFVMFFFLLADSHVFYNSFIAFFRKEKQKKNIVKFLDGVTFNYRRYLEALILVAFMTSFSMSLASYIFGIEYALVIGVLDFFAEFIPYVGPSIILIIGVFFAFVSAPEKVIIFIIIFSVTEFITSQVVAPHLISRKVGIRPFFVLFALFIGASVGGLIGLIFAIPLVVLVKEVISSFRSLYLEE